MEVRVDVGAGTVELIDPDEFTSFHVRPVPADADTVAVGALLDGALDDEHVWVRTDRLAGWAGAAATAQWRRGLDAMVRYAADHGWVRDDGLAVRAHLAR